MVKNCLYIFRMGTKIWFNRSYFGMDDDYYYCFISNGQKLFYSDDGTIMEIARIKNNIIV